MSLVLLWHGSVITISPEPIKKRWLRAGIADQTGDSFIDAKDERVSVCWTVRTTLHLIIVESIRFNFFFSRLKKKNVIGFKFYFYSRNKILLGPLLWETMARSVVNIFPQRPERLFLPSGRKTERDETLRFAGGIGFFSFSLCALNVSTYQSSAFTRYNSNHTSLKKKKKTRNILYRVNNRVKFSRQNQHTQWREYEGKKLLLRSRYLPRPLLFILPKTTTPVRCRKRLRGLFCSIKFSCVQNNTILFISHNEEKGAVKSLISWTFHKQNYNRKTDF